MKLAFLLWLYLNNTLNVMSYGATGNGSTDDTNSINSCFTAAESAGKSVYFPPGVYLCNNNAGVFLLQYNASGQNNITIYGAGNSQSTILTTKDTATCQLYINASSLSYGLVVSGITFSNTHHSTVVGQTNAIYMSGSSANDIDTVGFYNCKFSGFSNALVLQGAKGIYIKQDSFVSPNGHNNAQPNNNPAVYVTFADNSGGQCYNADMEQNYASGYTGALPITVPRPMDGFLYGFAYGILIQNNVTAMFSQEHYYLQNPITTPSTTSTGLFTNNFLDCSITSGWVDSNGAAHKYNYGIRTEASHVTIRNNYLLHYTNGIMIRGIDFPTITCTDYNITGNILVAGTDTSLYSLQKSIFTQGSTSFPLTLLNITYNKQIGIDTTGIQVVTATNPNLYSNPNSPVSLP